MDCSKVGGLISKLRKEKNLTQKNVADLLGITNKTVSKWECGLGCPDVSLWSDLAGILGADIIQLLEGEITLNKPDNGNINKVKLYVCPFCLNVLMSTGSCSIFCCGKKLEYEIPKWKLEENKVSVEQIDMEYYISINHPMTKENYILFSAYITCDKVFLNRMYPEQSPNFRFPMITGGVLYVYSSKAGMSKPLNII